MKFLEVVTRTYRRPTMLAQNQASVAAMGADVRHTILVDEVGIGCGGANARLAEFTPLGKYVWVLDDDDLCTYPALVQDLQYLDWLHGTPAAYLVRMDHGEHVGVLPRMDDWQRAPQYARIGCSGIITRRDVWLQHRHAWGTGHYASDWDFISSVWTTWQRSIVWLDVVASRCQRISHGLPEAA